MSGAVPTMPDVNSINTEYQRINGLIGEAYSIYTNHRKRLNALMKERDAVLAQWRLMQQMDAAKASVETEKTGD